MSKREIETALPYLKPRVNRYRKGSYVTMAGDGETSMHLILSGRVKIILEDLDGACHFITRYKAGGFFKESCASADGELSHYSSLVVDDAIIMTINFVNIMNMAAPIGKIFTKIMRNLFLVNAGKTIFLIRQLEHLSKISIRERLLSYFRHLMEKVGKNEFILPMSKSDLAGYLFVNRSAMARELAAMKKEKILSFKDRMFCLKI